MAARLGLLVGLLVVGCGGRSRSNLPGPTGDGADERQCTAGNAASCQRLGSLRLRRLGGDVEAARAETHLRRACALGRHDACLEIADYAEEYEANFEQQRWAFAGVVGACRQGHAASCYRVAASELVMAEELTIIDRHVHALAPAECAAGVARACEALATVIDRWDKSRPQSEREADIRIHRERALTLYRTGCARDELASCEGEQRLTPEDARDLGGSEADGSGDAEDSAAGASRYDPNWGPLNRPEELLERACLQGKDNRACVQLRGDRWAGAQAAACKLGSAQSCYLWSMDLQEGELAAALEQGCGHGSALSCLDASANDEDTPRTRAAILALLDQGAAIAIDVCRAGAFEHCHRLAEEFVRFKEAAHAARIYDASCRAGSAEGCYALGLLPKMTPIR